VGNVRRGGMLEWKLKRSVMAINIVQRQKGKWMVEGMGGGWKYGFGNVGGIRADDLNGWM
jgi:hypothetical protein